MQIPKETRNHDSSSSPAKKGNLTKVDNNSSDKVSMPVGFLLTALLVFSLDQGSKVLALKFLETGGEKISFVGDFITLQLISNPGAAFSFASGYTWIFTILPIAVLVVLGYLSLHMHNRYWLVSIGALSGGAAGNLVDRLIRPPGVFRGEVVDFINYFDWFIGNVADIAIVVAVVVIAVLSLLEVPTGMGAKTVKNCSVSTAHTADFDGDKDKIGLVESRAGLENSFETGDSSAGNNAAESGDGTDYPANLNK